MRWEATGRFWLTLHFKYYLTYILRRLLWWQCETEITGNPGGIRKNIPVRYDGSVLETKSTRFANRLDIGFERKRSTKHDSKVFDLNSSRIS